MLSTHQPWEVDIIITLFWHDDSEAQRPRNMPVPPYDRRVELEIKPRGPDSGTLLCSLFTVGDHTPYSPFSHQNTVLPTLPPRFSDWIIETFTTLSLFSSGTIGQEWMLHSRSLLLGESVSWVAGDLMYWEKIRNKFLKILAKSERVCESFSACKIHLT